MPHNLNAFGSICERWRDWSDKSVTDVAKLDLDAGYNLE